MNNCPRKILNYKTPLELLPEEFNDKSIISKIYKLQEVVNTPTGQAPTGNLVGLTISDEQEWKNVQKDIGNIIDDKQNKKMEAVRYLDIKLLQKLIVKSNRLFRLKEEMYYGKEDLNYGRHCCKTS